MSRQGGVGVHLMDAAPASCKNGSNSTGRRHASGVDCTAGSGSGGGGASCGVSVDYGLLEIDENDNSFPWGLIHHNELAQMLNSGLGKTMVIDSRSFLEYNTSTIQQSVNVCCSKLVKRRLQQDKVHVLDLLNQTCNIGADTSWDVIVYDQCTEDPSQLTSDNFVAVLLHKLSTTFNSVAFLKGGFLSFQASHPGLTENKSSAHRCSTLTSLSQPCMPVSNVGPTRILPFLYLGSQQDSLNQEVAQVNGITYILNVSKTCPRPHFILEGHFHRIPVNDNYCEKLLPFFQEAFQFLDKVREANGCVLIHCLGGVSRSATLAIAYIMRYYRMSSDEAYRYVKDKRPTISPNFNFLGQLLEYERSLRQEEQEEVARRKMMKDEEGVSGEFDRASPGAMDLHTSSPSSPGPRTAQRPFVAGSLPSLLQSRAISSYITSTSSTVGRVVRECPFPGPAGSDTGPLPKLMNQSASEQQTCVHRHLNSVTDITPLPGPSSDLCPFPGPSSDVCSFPTTDMCLFPGPVTDMCPFPGPATDMCPFPGPVTDRCPFPGLMTDMCPFPGSSLEFPGPSSETSSFSGPSSDLCPFPGPQTELCPMTESPHKKGPDPQHACLSADECNHETNVISTTVHVSHDLCSTKQTMALFCDNPRQDVLAPAPVCPLTGFPSPDGANGGFPGSTCPQTGFPGPGSHGSSSAAPRPTAVTTDSLGLTSASAASETLFKNTSTYHHLSESNGISLSTSHAVSSLQSNDSDSKHDLFHKSSQKEQTRPRHGFNLYSMLSNLRWKSRPPTLSLGSPVGPVKDGNRHAKKHTVENSTDGRLQLTPVSEAVENCDLITSDIVAADGVNRSTSWQSSCTESMEVSESDIATNVHEFGSNIFNATTIAMASTQSNLSSTLVLSAHTRLNSDSILVTSASPLSSVTSSVVKPTKLNIAIKKFTLPLSSPTSSLPGVPVSLLPSPGDSNKRKGFPPPCSDSPDKLAKTEVGSHHCSPSPPTTLNLTQSPVGEKKLKLASKRPFVLPISSPTAATADYLARLRVTSPSEPASEKVKQQGQMDTENDHKSRRSSCSDLETETKAHFSTESRDSLRRLHIKSRDPHSVSKACVPYGHTKWKSAGSLTVTETTVFGGAQLSTLQHKDTSLFSSIVGSSSSSSSSVSLSSSSLLSKSCTSIYSPSWVTSSAMLSSRAVNLQGFSQFPTTSLDKLSFTPCYTKDIVQELRKQESEQPATPEQGTSPSEGNLGPSVLDSPMSISSGSSAPSVASSTLSPVESTMTNPFSGGTIAHTSSAFPFTQSQSSSDNNMPSFGRAHEDESYPNPALSPSSASDFILSPSSLPQSTVAPTIPCLSSPYYCGSQSMESLSPMSLSDSSSSSPIRSPTRNGITSPLPSSIGSPSSSVSSPVVSSPPFSPLISSPVSSSSHMAGTVASITSSITTKVVLRRDKNRRVLDRPNSIAFSSYPACDLVPAASSDSSSLGQASQDDSSEVYMSSKSKRSRRSNHPESHASHGRTSWGGYSEREMYRQITAAMENAMLRTQVFRASSASRGRTTPGQVSSRKSKSLDDILDSNADEDEFLPSRAGGAPWSRHRTEMSMFEKYRCGMQNVSEPYHSNSSISSSGSHTGSMEIQLPR